MDRSFKCLYRGSYFLLPSYAKMKKTCESSCVKQGTLLLSEAPFAYVLKSSLIAERCDHCFARTELLTCSCCNYTRYCDRICQKKGWFFHKRECQNFKRIAPRILPDAARMLARIIFKLQKGGARDQGFYSPRQFRVFMDLMTHYNEIKNDSKRMEHFQSLMAVLEVFFGDNVLPNPVELLQIYGKMVVNTFCILDSEMQSIGTGMYLGASIVDHSCEPNAVAVFDGTTLIIRNIVELPTIDWSKIFISYVDLMRLPEERQKELQETYYFLCQCQRCTRLDDVDLLNAVICPNKQCGLQIKGRTLAAESCCSHCKEKLSPEKLSKINEILLFTDEQITSMRDVAYLDVCRLCLKKHEGLLDEMNIRHVKVLDMAMDCCIELELWEQAMNYGKMLYKPFLEYYGSYHPLTGVLFMKIGKLALFLEELDEARHWLKEASKILLITHGEQHLFVREELYMYMRQCSS